MVSKEEVRRVADNARIDIGEGEIEGFVEDFEQILGMFSTLEKIDTEDIEPAFHPVEVEPETREDTVEETLDRKEVFQNTENEEDGYFRGPSA